MFKRHTMACSLTVNIDNGGMQNATYVEVDLGPGYFSELKGFNATPGVTNSYISSWHAIVGPIQMSGTIDRTGGSPVYTLQVFGGTLSIPLQTQSSPVWNISFTVDFIMRPFGGKARFLYIGTLSVTIGSNTYHIAPITLVSFTAFYANAYLSILVGASALSSMGSAQVNYLTIDGESGPWLRNSLPCTSAVVDSDTYKGTMITDPHGMSGSYIYQYYGTGVTLFPVKWGQGTGSGGFGGGGIGPGFPGVPAVWTTNPDYKKSHGIQWGVFGGQNGYILYDTGLFGVVPIVPGAAAPPIGSNEIRAGSVAQSLSFDGSASSMGRIITFNNSTIPPTVTMLESYFSGTLPAFQYYFNPLLPGFFPSYALFSEDMMIYADYTYPVVTWQNSIVLSQANGGGCVVWSSNKGVIKVRQFPSGFDGAYRDVVFSGSASGAIGVVDAIIDKEERLIFTTEAYLSPPNFADPTTRYILADTNIHTVNSFLGAAVSTFGVYGYESDGVTPGTELSSSDTVLVKTPEGNVYVLGGYAYPFYATADANFSGKYIAQAQTNQLLIGPKTVGMATYQGWAQPDTAFPAVAALSGPYTTAWRGDEMYIAQDTASGIKLWHTTDRGKTLSDVTPSQLAGITTFSNARILIDPLMKDAILIYCDQGSNWFEGTLVNVYGLRSTDGLVTWSTVTLGPPLAAFSNPVDGGSFATDGGTPGVDGGNNWAQPGAIFSGIQIQTVGGLMENNRIVLSYVAYDSIYTPSLVVNQYVAPSAVGTLDGGSF